jgi:hypothetical protein
MYRDLSEAIAFKAADWHHRLPVAHVGWEAFLIILGALLVELGRRQLVIGAKAIVGFAGKLPNQFILANEIAKAVKDWLAFVASQSKSFLKPEVSCDIFDRPSARHN